MITSSPRSCRLILSASIAALLGSGLVGIPKAQAQIIKANNTDNLNLTTSWAGGVVPGAADIATWDATVTAANSTLLGADLTWGGIAITNPGGLITIGGVNRLTLSGPAGINLSAATQDLTINSSLIVNGTTALGSRVLTLGGPNSVLSGAVSGNAAAGITALNVSGGSLLLAGANTFTGQLMIGPNARVTARSATALGASGTGNETVVQAGGTLNIGGQTLGAERIRISGNGVGGIGALINQGANNIDAAQFISLAGNASINAGGNLPASYNAAGTAVAGSVGRFDLRLAAYTAGAANLDLAGNTLTKIGAAQIGIVHADVTQGHIVVNEGTLFLQEGTVLNGAGSITVNQNGKLAFWGLTNNGAGIAWPITVNGGSIGETLGTSASQTMPAPIIIAGSLNPNFASGSNTTTFTGLISKDAASTATELAKRGAQVLVFSNTANSFDIPVTIYQGTLRANFNTSIGAGGVPPNTPLTSTDTPLGTNSTIKLAGGTLSLRINMANDGTLQRWALNKGIVVDLAPSAMDFDRLSNTAQTNKHVIINSLTFTPPNAANGYSIGQNQFTFTQGNTHRLEIPLMTMARDTVLLTGDDTLSGNILSSGKNSLIRSGGNTTQFVTGDGAPVTHEFNAYFALGGTTRVGTGFGTPNVDPNITVGTGAITVAPGAGVSFRTPNNIAAGQTINLVSQRVSMAAVNLELFNSVPENLRAAGTGVIGVGSSTSFGDIDLSRLGDGTFRIGSNISGSGNGVISGVISPGVGGVVRMGASGTAGTGIVTVNGFNAITGNSSLEIGSALINGGFTTTIQGNNSGTVILTSDNNYSGGTTVNRASTLRFQSNASLGSGPIDVFGTLTGEQFGGVFTMNGLTNHIVPNLFGGGSIVLDNAALRNTDPQNRWGDNQPLNLLAGGLTYSSPDVTSPTSGETIGATTFAGGSSITINRTQQPAVPTPHLATVTLSSLARAGRGTLELVRNGGNGAGFGNGLGQQLFVTTGAPTPVNGMVSPYYVINGVTEQNSFATYGANGFTPVTFTNILRGTFDTGLVNGTELVYVDFLTGTTTLTLGDNPVIYALKVGAGAAGTTINSSGANNLITIRSGGLVISGDSTTGNFSTAASTATINPGLSFHNGTNPIEGVVNVRSGYTGQVNGAITANGLTKFGAGTLNISSNQTSLTGEVSVNQGVLQVFGPQTTNATHNPVGTGVIRLNGGQLNVRAANIAGTAFSTSNNGSYVLQNGLTVATNIPLAVADFNRAGADTTSSGTITFNPAVSGPGLVLEGSAGVQGQTLTFSGANYGVTFGNNALNTFNGNVTINNAVTVTLNNNPTINGTKPVITKSGAGTLIVGPAFPQPAGITVAPDTQVQVNAGVLELRSIFAFGNGGNGGTSITINGGTLNLRRDSAGTYGGLDSTPYALTINGNSTISTDRLSAGTNFAEGLGTLTINGSPTVTFNNGNGVYPRIFGSVDGVSMKLNGLPFVASNVAPGSIDTALRLDFPVVGGGFVKLGTGHMHLRATSTYTGGTYVNQGVLRARASEALGTGPIYLNPGAILDLASFDSIGTTQPLIIRSNSAFMPMLSVNTDFQHPLGTNVDTTQAPTGILGLSNGTGGNYSSAVNLSTYYGGRWSLGGVPTGPYDPVFTGDTLTAGLDALYRLGGGGTSFAMGTDEFRTARTNVLTGPNNVRLGFDSGNLFPVNATNFQYSIAGVNDYSGGSTVIHRGMVARLFSPNDGLRSGLSNSNVDVFGILGFGGLGSLSTGAANTNAVTLHPGSGLVFDSANGAANGISSFAASNITDRWNDTTPIALNGAFLNLNGQRDAATSETVGSVTYSRGARIRVGRSPIDPAVPGTGSSELTMANLLGAGPGNTLALQTTLPGTLGAADKIIVTNNPPAVTNGMVSPSIVNITDNTYVTYGANGFANVAYDTVFAGGNIPAGLASTAKLDLTTAAATLSDDVTVYALRTSQNINVGGPFSTVTLRSGGLIGTGGTIQPNLVFNDGSSNIEARIYVNGTLTINGTITANGITKFGHTGTANGAAGTLVIGVPQPNYTSGWTVNSGVLQINDPQGLGQSVPTNTITLNASLSTTGQVNSSAGGTNYAPTQLTLTYNSGSPELATFTGGPITVVNEGTVRIAAGDDRNLQGLPVTLTSTSTASRVGFTFDVPNNRFRGIIPSLTLMNDAVVRVTDSGSTTDTGRVTTGVVSQLNGTGKNMTKIGNRTLELPNDNSTTFTGGSITISQGTVRVRHNGSLGSATTGTIIERNATLEIDTDAFTPVGQVTQLPGSIERWNRETARPGTTYNLPAGVNLQLNTNLLSTRTIGLNGGSIEGFEWIDHPAAAALRTVSSNVTINLLADSFVGQNILQGQGYDAGRQPTVSGPFGDNVTGTFLQIDGNITGNFNLTKTGADTVTIAGTANSYRNTAVELGVLRTGSPNALPSAGILTTRLNGTLDLYGNNQTVAGLGVSATGTDPGGTSVGSSGRIINSAPTENVLRVNTAGDFTYNGQIEQNVALTKSGVGTLRLNAASGYRGVTTVEAGTLVVNAALSGTSTIDVRNGATFDVTGAVGGFFLGSKQLLKGDGIVKGTVTTTGAVAPGSASVGMLTVDSLTSFGDGATLQLELNGAASFDRLVTNGIALDGTVLLSINLGFSPSPNTQFLVVDNTSSDAAGGGTKLFSVNGPEGQLTEGEQFLVGAQVFSITYLGGTGNDVILTAVPEPSSIALVGGAIGLLGLRRRRSVR